MLNRLRFENFKTWAKAQLEFGLITGLFGTNSSGKTSLIQFLLLLKQTKNASDRSLSLELNGDLVSLGTYREMIFSHDEERELSWRLDIRSDTDLAISDPSKRRSEILVRSSDFSIESVVHAKAHAPRSKRLSYGLGSMAFSLSPRGADETAFDLRSRGGDFKFRRTIGRPWQLPGPVKSYAFPDQARTYFQNSSFLSDFELAFEKEMDRIFYLGPLREYPQRDYLWARSKPSDVGQRGEKVIEAILAATEANEKRNLKPKGRLKGFQEIIAHWLNEMGLIADFRVEEIAEGSNRWQARVRVRRGGTQVLLTDVGFGVSQVLPVLTLLYYVPQGSTVILEQPEIHLHPSAQAYLADVILNVSINRRIQVILESHSEHLLLRLQRRIAEEEISADRVKLYFCDVSGGNSELELLKLDLFGNIQNWPKNFMGDAFGETAAAEKARLKRMIATE